MSQYQEGGAAPDPTAPSDDAKQQAADARRASLVAIASAGGALSFMPRTFDEVWRLSNVFAKGADMVPKAFRGNVEMCAICIMKGMELGLSPTQAFEGIAVINGRPGVWGDTHVALVQRQPDYVNLIEEELFDVAPNGDKVEFGWKITAQRKGRVDVVRKFTMADAARARLTLKADTPWQTYPHRMCFNRARAWAMRDQFPEATKGMASADELRDAAAIAGEFTVVDTKAAPEPRTTPQARAADAAAATATAAVQYATSAALGAPQPDLLADLAGSMARTQTAEKVIAATPDLAALAGNAATGAGAVHKDDAPQATVAGDGLPGFDLATAMSRYQSTPDPAPIPKRAPLSTGQQQLLEAYQNTAQMYGVTQQDVFDELGDSIHGGNVDQAIAYLQRRCQEGAAAGSK